MSELIKIDHVQIDGRTYTARYFQITTPSGRERFSLELVLGPGDRIIFDGNSLYDLESRMTRIVPATVYSRILAARAA